MNMTTVSPTEGENIELLRLGELNAPLVVSMNSFQGRRYFDIRRHYFDKTSKTIKPGPKGIALKEDEFALISSYITENINAIQAAFTDNLRSNEMAIRGERREKIARTALKESDGIAEVQFSSWPGAHFFSYEKSPSATKIKFNKRNKFVNKVEADGDASIEILVSLVSAYIKSKSSLDFAKKVDPEIVTEFLEMHWGNNLIS